MWVWSEDIACEIQRRGSASSADVLVLADATFALQVGFVADFGEELVVLHPIPDALQALGLDVSKSVYVVVAARDGIPVLRNAHEFAKETSTEEEVVKPVIPVRHPTLLCYACEARVVNVDFGLSFVVSA